jgi:hypothetical protein
MVVMVVVAEERLVSLLVTRTLAAEKKRDY